MKIGHNTILSAKTRIFNVFVNMEICTKLLLCCVKFVLKNLSSHFSFVGMDPNF
jgi:hypothetical protein